MTFGPFAVANVEVFYLVQRLLEIRPNLVDIVEADLPPGATLSSSMVAAQINELSK